MFSVTLGIEMEISMGGGILFPQKSLHLFEKPKRTVHVKNWTDIQNVTLWFCWTRQDNLSHDGAWAPHWAPQA